MINKVLPEMRAHPEHEKSDMPSGVDRPSGAIPGFGPSILQIAQLQTPAGGTGMPGTAGQAGASAARRCDDPAGNAENPQRGAFRLARVRAAFPIFFGVSTTDAGWHVAALRVFVTATGAAAAPEAPIFSGAV